jgi:hypothetical protein
MAGWRLQSELTGAIDPIQVGTGYLCRPDSVTVTFKDISWATNPITMQLSTKLRIPAKCADTIPTEEHDARSAAIEFGVLVENGLLQVNENHLEVLKLVFSRVALVDSSQDVDDQSPRATESAAVALLLEMRIAAEVAGILDNDRASGMIGVRFLHADAPGSMHFVAGESSAAADSRLPPHCLAIQASKSMLDEMDEWSFEVVANGGKLCMWAPGIGPLCTRVSECLGGGEPPLVGGSRRTSRTERVFSAENLSGFDRSTSTMHLSLSDAEPDLGGHSDVRIPIRQLQREHTAHGVESIDPYAEPFMDMSHLMHRQMHVTSSSGSYIEKKRVFERGWANELPGGPAMDENKYSKPRAQTGLSASFASFFTQANGARLVKDPSCWDAYFVRILRLLTRKPSLLVALVLYFATMHMLMFVIATRWFILSPPASVTEY